MGLDTPLLAAGLFIELRIQLIKNAEFIVLVFDYGALGVEIVVRKTEFNQVKQWEFALLAMAAMGLK